MDKAIIDVSVVIATMIGSRDVVHTLKEVILRTRSRSVDLDLKNVEFLSRSAAHELLTLKDDLSYSLLRKKLVSFINARDNVSEMLRIVAASRAMPKLKHKECRIERADSNFFYDSPSA